MSVNINLLPKISVESYQLKKRALALSSSFAAIVIPVISTLTFLSIMFNLQSFALLKMTDTRINKAVEKYNSRKEIETKILSFQRKSAVFREIYRNHKTYSPLLEIIAKQIPESVSFDTLQFTPNGVRIWAKTPSIIAFAQMITNLLSSNFIREIILTESRYSSQEKNYRVAIEIPLLLEAVFRK